jgi:hypothetical protein
VKSPIIQLSACLFIMLLITVNANAQQDLSVTISIIQPISCNGGHDAILNAELTGGASPYSYKWSNHENTQSISGLEAGYYRVEVTDNNNVVVSAEITLRNPDRLGTEVSIHTYANGFNVTSHNENDGIVNTNPSGGTAPYSFLWSDGSSTQNRMGILAGNYVFLITDAHGCNLERSVFLSAPERDDWQNGGNSSTNPPTHFLGTRDNKDLVFKTSNSEAVRIKSNGDLKLSKLTGGIGTLYVDSNGIIQSGRTTAPCNGLQSPIWLSNYPNNIFTCPATVVGIGTYNFPSGIRFTVSGNSYFDGSVGIGTLPQSGYKLVVDGNVGFREVRVKASGPWPDFVFNSDYRLRSFAEIKEFIRQNNRLPDMPTATSIEANGQQIGELQRLQQQKIEELVLYSIELNDKMEQITLENKRLLERVNELEKK